MSDTKYVSIHELARRLGLPRAYLQAEAMAGRIPALRVGRRWMFDAADVEDALRRQTQKGACDDAPGP